MYVRTKKGIFNCFESEQMNKKIYYPKNSKTNGYIDYNEVCKKSENIFDVLEIGDLLVVKDFCDELCMVFHDEYLLKSENQILNIKYDLEKNENKQIDYVLTNNQIEEHKNIF